MDADLRELVRRYSAVMQPFVQASKRVETNLGTHIRQYEVPFNLQQLERALWEQSSNESARYHEAIVPIEISSDAYHSVKVAQTRFSNEKYGLLAILRDDGKVFLRIEIVDDELGFPVLIDYTKHVKLTIEDLQKKEVASSTLHGVSTAEFDFKDLGSNSYTARLQPL